MVGSKDTIEDKIHGSIAGDSSMFSYWSILVFIERIFFSCFEPLSLISSDFPGGSDGKSICLQCGRPGFDP